MTEPSSPAVLAHRGVSVEFPENTIQAFAAAADRGADGVELDVRRTADAALVVHHDAHLADGRVLVDLDRSELPGEVPTLAEVLAVCDGLQVNIEIKNVPGDPDFDPDCTVADRVVAQVRSRSMVDRVIVSSFNYQDIQRVRALDDHIATGWLVLDVSDPAGMLDFAVAHGHTALHPPADHTTVGVIDAAHGRGILVNTWTVDDPERIIELADQGVDAVITNDPAGARAALEGRTRAG